MAYAARYAAFAFAIAISAAIADYFSPLIIFSFRQPFSPFSAFDDARFSMLLRHCQYCRHLPPLPYDFIATAPMPPPPPPLYCSLTLLLPPLLSPRH